MLAVNILKLMCKFRPCACISVNICTMSMLPQLFSDLSVITAHFRLFCASGLRHDASTPLIHAMRCTHYIVLEQILRLQHFDSKEGHDIVQGQQLCIVHICVNVLYCSFLHDF